VEVITPDAAGRRSEGRADHIGALVERELAFADQLERESHHDLDQRVHEDSSTLVGASSRRPLVPACAGSVQHSCQLGARRGQSKVDLEQIRNAEHER
jgi:hypothetical protein